MFKGFFIGLASSIMLIVASSVLPSRDPYHDGARLAPVALVFGFLVFLFVWKLDAQKKKRREEAEMAEFRAKTSNLDEKKG